MRVRDVMVRDVQTVPDDETVQTAAQLMAEADVGALLVGTRDAVHGILTDRDILIRAVAQGRDVTATRVAEVMSTSLYDCHEDVAFEEARHLMEAKQVRRLPVRDDSGRLVGLLGYCGLVRAAETGNEAA